MDGNFEQARNFFLQGLDHYQGERFLDAERCFAASLALLPGRASTLTNLGATRLKLGKHQDAADLLQEAVSQEPDNVEALGHLATALAELGHPTQALDRADQALRLNPQLAPMWSLRGTLFRDMGRLPEARQSFEQAIACGGDTQLNRYYLASVSGQDAPPTAPAEYVQALFDGYAEGFEEHLVEVLNYRAPEILAAELARTGRTFARALDLGCGTGLCGLKLRPLARALDGVDLSANMVERAGQRGVYTELAQADLVSYLDTTQHRYDLVVAADVFIYVGALEAVFAGVARVLDAGGLFCFSVEAAGPDAEQPVLRPSLRYAHSLRYIQKLAGESGFELTATAEHPIRKDQGAPIPGLFAWLVRR